jgi:hypothetical protein
MSNIGTKAARVALQLLCLISFAAKAATNESLATLDEVLAAKQDVWGLAAMREPNGPSYEFFEKLLPPLRYVNAEFRYYPIVLSAPNATVKARFTSNGSGLNARANLKTWKEVGVPVTFRVGEDQQVFGKDLAKLDGPHLERGWLPIVRLSYEHLGKVYAEEAFAATETALASNGVVLVQFGLESRGLGHIAAQFDSLGPLIAIRGTLQNTNGEVVAWFDESWRWIESQKKLAASFSRKQRPTLAFATKPVPGSNNVSLPRSYEMHRKLCVAMWQSLLDHATQLEVPEPIVNNAWRSTVIGALMLRTGDHMNYSAGNQYERLYEAECGDTLRGLVLFGRGDEMRAPLVPLLDYTRTNGAYSLKFHQAAFKLQMLAHYYWLTCDATVMREFRSRWQKEVNVLMDGRDPATGLLPKEQYAGDIFTRVVSLNSNANGWRGLRDIAAVLADMGETAEAQRIAAVAMDFREAILAAVKQSEFLTTQPPFIPLGLFGEEQPYNRLTESKMSSYYNEMASYIIGAGVFGVNAEREKWMIDYLQEHGGIAMGMIRFHQHSGLFANEDGVDDLYSLRYVEKLLQRDEVDRALVSFYGKLAQGLTRETFIGAEGTSFKPLDDLGRPMYCPPNSTGNAFFLWMLRDLLVQDWDMNDDGKPETLRLCFATPKRWLEDGKKITFERAPTAFGEVSVRMESKLKSGKVVAQVTLPQRNVPTRILLRARVPDGWRVKSASVSGRVLGVDERGTVDISGLVGRQTIRFTVTK